jgi:hypothetical protein
MTIDLSTQYPHCKEQEPTPRAQRPMSARRTAGAAALVIGLLLAVGYAGATPPSGQQTAQVLTQPGHTPTTIPSKPGKSNKAACQLACRIERDQCKKDDPSQRKRCIQDYLRCMRQCK